MESKALIGYNQLLTAIQVAEHDQFSLPLFEDFNRLVEAVVLYDRVVFLGEYEVPHSGFFTILERSQAFDVLTQEKLAQLVRTSKAVQDNFEGAVQHIFGSSAIGRADFSPDNLISLRNSPNSFAQAVNEYYFHQVIAYNKKDGFDVIGFVDWLSKLATPSNPGVDTNVHYFARALIYTAIGESEGMDYAPDMLRTPLAALAFSRKRDFLSKQLYEAMVDKFRKETEELRLLGMPTQVFIPPLTALVLKKAPGPNNYASEILSLRDKFTPYRKTYREFNELVADPEQSITKKLKAKKQLDTSIRKIIDQDSSDHALNIQTVFDSLVNTTLGNEGVSASLSITAVLSVLLKQLQVMRVRGRAKALFDLWSDTKNLKDYGGLIEKAFEVQIEPSEANSLRNYSSAIRSIIRGRTEDNSYDR